METATVAVLVLSMVASWYGPGFHGRTAASGEVYDQNALTAAHRTLPFDTLLLLEHGGNRVTVRINDRGPYCVEAVAAGRLAPHPERELDLSREAFIQLAPLSAGVIQVRVRFLRYGEALLPRRIRR